MVAMKSYPETGAPLARPAVSGVVRANLQAGPIDCAGLEGLVDTPEAGACVSFVGRVRRHDAGRDVVTLEYTSHPTAEAEVYRIARKVRAGCNGGVRDRVDPPHRARELVERVKHELPVWKHQVFADGSDEWVGSA